LAVFPFVLRAHQAHNHQSGHRRAIQQTHTFLINIT